MRNNPIPFVIPCHRVVAAGHRIGGYGGGRNAVALKRELSIPLTLAAYQGKRTVTHADIPALVDVAVNDICHQTNPRPCARADFERIFAAAI